MNTVYLGLGSNIGKREEYIKLALHALKQHLNNIECAQLYETAPQDYTEQPFFLNTVCRGQTTLSPESVIAFCQHVEAMAGRNKKREISKGPRTLDIDILLYDDLVLQTPVLQLPHPRISKRRFVLLPLLELEPACRDPLTKQRYDSFLAATKTQELRIWNSRQ